MPNDAKASVSIVVLIFAGVLAYWGRSPVRPEFASFIMLTAVFMIIAMWLSPGTGTKKGGVERPANRE